MSDSLTRARTYLDAAAGLAESAAERIYDAVEEMPEGATLEERQTLRARGSAMLHYYERIFRAAEALKGALRDLERLDQNHPLPSPPAAQPEA